MVKEEQEILQRNLSQFLLKDVFNTITQEDVIEVRAPNVWFHKGQQLLPEKIKSLKAQAKNLLDSTLWPILRDELRWHAFNSAFLKSQTEADLISGKMLGYLVNTIEERLKRMIEN